jgi:hypothetical protein
MLVLGEVSWIQLICFVLFCFLLNGSLIWWPWVGHVLGCSPSQLFSLLRQAVSLPLAAASHAQEVELLLVVPIERAQKASMMCQLSFCCDRLCRCRWAAASHAQEVELCWWFRLRDFVRCWALSVVGSRDDD